VLALAPLTYMNESGQAIAAAMRFYKLTPADVIVIHDELELAPGKMRVKTGGGAAGHNGLKSIDAHIGPDYHRVRLGIGHPGVKHLVHDYVLQDFPKADEPWVEKLVDAVAEAMPLLVTGDGNGFMNKVTLTLNPPPPRPARAAAAPES
jgi:PTH1 family peptidyl-tRNA hydrolase